MPKKRRNNSCNSSSLGPPLLGPPLLGPLPATGPLAALSNVRILTTEGPTISTKSVKSGKVREAALDCAQAGCKGVRAGSVHNIAVRLKAPNQMRWRLSVNGLDDIRKLPMRRGVVVFEKIRLCEQTPASPWLNMDNLAFLKALEHQSAIGSTKTKVIFYRDLNFHVSSRIGAIVQIALGVWVVQIDGGRCFLVVQG